MTTPILGLTEVAGSQEQPHVPINAATRALEIFGQIIVETLGDDAPPGSPADGDAYIVGANPTGAWAGHAWDVAYYSGGWLFLNPREGWLAWVLDEGQNYRYTASSPPWDPQGSGGSDAADITYDGSTDVAAALDSAFDWIERLLATAIPYSQPGMPSDGAVYQIMIPFPLTIPAGLAGTYGYAGTLPTATATYSLSKNGAAAFGTIAFGTSSPFPTLTAASPTSFNAGDRLTITAPTPQDATLANVGFTIRANRSF